MPLNPPLHKMARAFALVLALATLGACAQMSALRSTDSNERAGELFLRLKAEQAQGRYTEASLTAQELIQNHAEFPSIDEATFRAGEVAMARGLYVDAAKYFEATVSRYPLSPFREPALLNASRAYVRNGSPVESADALLRLLSAPAADSLRSEASADLRELLDGPLTAPQVEALFKKYPASNLTAQVALRAARREYANGNYDESYALLTKYLYQFPEGPDAPDARRLLAAASERRQAPGPAVASPVDPNTVGVVLPMTGPGAPYGRHFAQGVDIAVAEHNATSNRRVTVVKADSRGNAVGAVRAVRRLLLEDAAVGIVGSVFTMPTVAAAIEANAWGAALLSPVVSSDELPDIGPWVFQTKVPLEVEVSAVAELAVSRLVIGRFAVVAPSNGSRRALGDLFRDEVERLGAEVVAMVFYETGATDFRAQLEAVREAAPEAIFAPGEVDELLLLIPQIKFYDLQLQLLGLSDWNSDKLLRLSRDELEGALFPAEAYRGNDPAAYGRYEEAVSGRVNPVSEAGYFGMRLLLQALEGGASSRDDVRGYLERELRQGAAGRMAEARALSFLRVRGGRIEAFPAHADR